MAKKRKKKKRKKSSPQKLLFDKCWSFMSLISRLKFADAKGMVKCVTCETKKHYTKMNAGHYFHKKLDFDNININPQCVRCNKFLSGNLAEYTIFIMTEYGEKALKDLQEKAKKFTAYTEKELQKLLTKLESEAVKIKKEFGIS
jgi:hypothetical protein